MAGSSGLRAAEAAYAKEALATSDVNAPWRWYIAAAFCFVVDRILKTAALSGASLGLKDRAEFTLFMNHGIAFSIPVPDAAFWAAAAVASAALVWSYAKSFRTDVRAAAILGVIILGAASNLYDRVMYDATVDYLLFFGRSAVNLADGMIIGGLLALVAQDRRAEKGMLTTPVA